MTETFDDIADVLSDHFSLHDVIEMVDLLRKYREYEHRLIRNYSEDDFNDFLKEYLDEPKEEECPF